MDKGVKKILGANDMLTCGKKRTSPLDPILTKLVGGGGGGGGGGVKERGEQTEKRERKREFFLERDSNFSLNFPTI